MVFHIKNQYFCSHVYSTGVYIPLCSYSELRSALYSVGKASCFWTSNEQRSFRKLAQIYDVIQIVSSHMNALGMRAVISLGILKGCKNLSKLNTGARMPTKVFDFGIYFLCITIFNPRMYLRPGCYCLL